MKRASWKLRGALLVAGLVAGALFQPRHAQAGVYGLWVNPKGDLACGADCAAGQKCCSIVILPAG